jgi:hypothetical protein
LALIALEAVSNNPEAARSNVGYQPSNCAKSRDGPHI